MAIKYDSQGTDPNVDFMHWTDEDKGYDGADVLVLEEDGNVRWSAGLGTSCVIKTNKSSAYIHVASGKKSQDGANTYKYDPHSYYTYSNWMYTYSYGNNHITTDAKIRYNDPFEIVGRSNTHTSYNPVSGEFSAYPVLTWTTWKNMGNDFYMKATTDPSNPVKPIELDLQNFCSKVEDFFDYNYVVAAYSDKEFLTLDFSPKDGSLYGSCWTEDVVYPSGVTTESQITYARLYETTTAKPAYIEISKNNPAITLPGFTLNFYLYATLKQDVVWGDTKGKKIPGDWTLISGQSGRTGARYQVGYKSIDSKNNLGFNWYSSNSALSTITLADSDLSAPVITSADWWNSTASTVTYTFKIQNNNNMNLNCYIWTNEEEQNDKTITINAQSSKTVAMTFEPGDVYFIFYTDNESNCSAKTTKTIEAYPVTITAGDNVNAVWLSTKTYIGGTKHASGTLFPKNTTVRGFAQLNDGYVLGDDSTYLGKDTSLESNNKVYRVPGSLTVTNPAYWSFGTITGLELQMPSSVSATYSLLSGRKVQYTIGVTNPNSFAVTATYSSSTPSVDGSNTISASWGSYSGIATGLVPVGAQAYVKFSKDDEETDWKSTTWEYDPEGSEIQIQ